MKRKKHKKLTWENAKVGWIECEQIYGRDFWSVKLSEDSGIWVSSQGQAQIISMLVRIMEKLGMKEDIDYFEEEV